jgi:hypothetical protein
MITWVKMFAHIELEKVKMMSKTYIIQRREEHTVYLTYEVEINEDELKEVFGDVDPYEIGEDELSDASMNGEIEMDMVDEDWWSMNKGGYDIDWEIKEFGENDE